MSRSTSSTEEKNRPAPVRLWSLGCNDFRIRKVVLVGRGSDVPSIHGTDHFDASRSRTEAAAAGATKEVNAPILRTHLSFNTLLVNRQFTRLAGGPAQPLSSLPKPMAGVQNCLMDVHSPEIRSKNMRSVRKRGDSLRKEENPQFPSLRRLQVPEACQVATGLAGLRLSKAPCRCSGSRMLLARTHVQCILTAKHAHPILAFQNRRRIRLAIAESKRSFSLLAGACSSSGSAPQRTAEADDKAILSCLGISWDRVELPLNFPVEVRQALVSRRNHVSVSWAPLHFRYSRGDRGIVAPLTPTQHSGFFAHSEIIRPAADW